MGQMFESAIDAINEYGWIQGQLGNREIGMCAYGALLAKYGVVVSGFVSFLWADLEKIECIFREESMYAPHRYNADAIIGRLAAYNDNASTTKEDIILLLKKAGV